MSLISKEALLAFLEMNEFHLSTAAGMKIIYRNEVMFTHFAFDLPGKEGLFKFYIITEEERPDAFIRGFKIHNIEDIHNLGYNDFWMRYLNGDAEIGMEIIELDAVITFRLYKSRTIIFSMDLHFYDEEIEHLTLVDDFLKYFSSNEKRLQAAAMNRYKL
ncbi:hypothetical protein BH23BAC1_BH23BAC1_36740 [soil metagenome]